LWGLSYFLRFAFGSLFASVFSWNAKTAGEAAAIWTKAATFSTLMAERLESRRMLVLSFSFKRNSRPIHAIVMHASHILDVGEERNFSIGAARCGNPECPRFRSPLLTGAMHAFPSATDGADRAVFL
jgi:hypothetical protein